MNLENSHNSNKSKNISIMLWSLYYLLAPFEDFLNFGAGTILIYIVILIFFVAIIEKNMNFKSINNIDFSIIYMIVLCWISYFWSLYPSITLKRNITYTLLPMFYLIARYYKLTWEKYLYIRKFAIIGGVLCACYLIMKGKDYYETGRYTLAINDDPNNIAALLLLPILLLLFSLIEKVNKENIIYSILKLISFMMMLYSFLKTGSRGGCIGLIVGIISYYFIFEYQKENNEFTFIRYLLFLNKVLIKSFNKRRFYKIIYMLLLFAILLVFAYHVLPENLLLRFKDMDAYSFNNEHMGTNRMMIWKNCFTILWPQRPLLGYGSAGFLIPLGEIEYMPFRACHNMYIALIMEYGFGGLPVILYFLFEKLKMCVNNNIIIESSILIGICIISCFLDAYSKKFLWNIIVLCTLACQAKQNTNRVKNVQII